MGKIIVTSALPYVNNVPHLGTVVCIISADVYARYLKLKGKEVISVLGTDEHGTTAETKALEEGMTPKELVDKYFKIHKGIYDWFNCSFDCFGRTSSEQNHKISQDIFKKLYKHGYIVEKEVEQLFCESCKRFLSDRFVEGVCPFCGFEDARGDQCDKCGKLLSPEELKSPRCKICKQHPVMKKSRHLYIDLPKLEPRLRAWMDSVKENWSQNALTMTDAWLKEGLRPRAITRDLRWGIPVPLEGFEDKVFYSWFDAPIGYISITAENRDDWKDWWKDEKTRLVQFMGKDNIPFHTILFPSFCIGAADGYTLVKDLSVNEYLNYEGGKFSKSRNIGVFGDDAMQTGVPADVWRYYLMINRPERADTEFSWDDFKEKLNNELVANLGNLVNRTVTFLNRYFDSVVPDAELDNEFYCKVEEKLEKIESCYEEIRLKEAAREVMQLARLGNQYFQENEPWKLVSADKAKAEKVMLTLANLIKDLSVVAKPLMPKAADEIASQLNLGPIKWNATDNSLAGQKVCKAELLFRKLDSVEEFRKRYGGRSMEFPFELKVAEIKEVKEHPDADKLMVLSLDVGDEKRQIVAGVKGYYKPDELIGKRIIIVTNLMIAKLRGVESNGMLLAADVEGKPHIIFAERSEPGEAVKPEGMQVSAEILSIEQFRKMNRLQISKGKLCYDCNALITKNEEIISDAPDGSAVR